MTIPDKTPGTELPEPAATMVRLTEKLRYDLGFAAPEVWPLHIERRLAEAYEAGEEAGLAAAMGRIEAGRAPVTIPEGGELLLSALAREIAKDWNGRVVDLAAIAALLQRGGYCIDCGRQWKDPHGDDCRADAVLRELAAPSDAPEKP